jgi:hypothetical protein
MPEQLLFKYRSLENWQFLLDILVNNRLYAAPFKDLNDPMERRYYYFGDEMTSVQETGPSREGWRITRDEGSAQHAHVVVLLGRPYRCRAQARGAEPAAYQIRDVFYDSQIGIGPNSARRPPREVALDILSQKQLSWAHEREVRVFSPQPFVPIRLREIKVGVKASPTDRELLEVLVRKTNPRVRIVPVRRADLDAPPEAFDQARAA